MAAVQPQWQSMSLSRGRARVLMAGHGLPVVLLHGFTAGPQFYWRIITRLANLGCRVIAPELPAAGVPVSDGFTMEQYRDMVLEVLEQLGVRRAVFVGHSMGGQVAAAVVAKRPDLAIHYLPVNGIQGSVWDEMISDPRVWAALLWRLIMDCLWVPTGSRPDALAASSWRGLVANFRHPISRLAAPGGAILGAKSAHLLEKIKAEGVPVTVLHGTSDLAIPLEVGAATARETGGRLLEVVGGRHSWLLMDPSTFREAIEHLMTDTGPLRQSLNLALANSGLDMTASPAELEAAFMTASAEVVWHPSVRPKPHRPRYTLRWTDENPPQSVSLAAS